jgi:hypothetical protein
VNPLSTPSGLRTLNAKWFSVSWQVPAAFEGYKGAVPPLAALPFPQPFFPFTPVSFVKTCSMPADTVPQCLSHAGNCTNPSPRVAWPRPILLDPDRVPTHYWSSRTPAVAISRSRSHTLPIVKMPHQQPCLNLWSTDLRYRVHPAV